MTNRLQFTRATREDIPAVSALVRRFHSISGEKISGFREEAFAKNWEAFMSLDLGVLLIAKDGEQVVGALGALCVPDALDGELVASEMFWFTAPEVRTAGAGLTLFSQFEDWAKERGAKRAVMAHLQNSMPERLARFYSRRGYSPAETHFIKHLS